ncbi:MAG: hypothetical protein AAF327_15685, partial [Cyanobacteria bacterium P01_A01_bin.37]
CHGKDPACRDNLDSRSVNWRQCVNGVHKNPDQLLSSTKFILISASAGVAVGAEVEAAFSSTVRVN